MNRGILVGFLAAVFGFPGRPARAEATVTVEHNEGQAATEEFRFKAVPGPRMSAARQAIFTVADGARDGNSPGTDVPQDGKVANEADQPESNFFFQNGTADSARHRFGVNNAAAHWTLPDHDPQQSYRDSYRVTARFLAWVEEHGKPGIVVTLDKAMRDGTYTAETWKQQTGKTVDELWADYGKNPAL